MSEQDEPGHRPRRVRKAREPKSHSRWLERRGAVASARRPDEVTLPAPAAAPVPVVVAAPVPVVEAAPAEASFDEHAADFFGAGDQSPVLAHLDLDDDAEASARAEAVARAAARRRSLARPVLGVVLVSLLLCVAGFVRSVAKGTSTNVFPPAAVLGETTGAVPLAIPGASSAVIANAEPPSGAVPPASSETPPSAEARVNAAPVNAAAPTAAPNPARALREEARAALERGAGAAAISAGQRSVAVDPTDAEAWLILGAAYQQAGQEAAAQAAFASCARLAKRGPVGECASFAP